MNRFKKALKRHASALAVFQAAKVELEQVKKMLDEQVASARETIRVKREEIAVEEDAIRYALEHASQAQATSDKIAELMNV